LTNKCNLRCSHCFQWNDKGFHKDMDKSLQDEEIDILVIQKIFEETSNVKSNLYLWGGEPLSYGKLSGLADLLEKDPRWTVFCTNGIEVERNLDSLNKMSKSLAMLLSLEGFEKENDKVRGKGTYNNVMKNIEMLLNLKRKNVFKGEVSVNCVISKYMIGKLYDFAVMFEEIGINTLYFCFPWYISDDSACRMDLFFEEKFSWLRTLDKDHKPSWHSYKYSIDSCKLELLLDDIKRITDRRWKIRMRFQPALEKNEIKDFLTGNEQTAQRKTKCMGIRNRMNVMPNGKVTVCKLFPEFEIGDLNKAGVHDIWNCSDFRKTREILSCGLMPVCSRCILLYLHGV
jgi:radical SAM protein with 4Fe4S-binding SPASM domain